MYFKIRLDERGGAGRPTHLECQRSNGGHVVVLTHIRQTFLSELPAKTQHAPDRPLKKANQYAGLGTEKQNKCTGKE